MKPSTKRQIQLAYGRKLDCERTRQAKAEIVSACEHLSLLMATNVPDGRHLNWALKAVEDACLAACQGIDIDPA